MSVATTDDVAVAIGRSLAGAEEDQVSWWLDSAEIQIVARLGDVTLLNQDVVKYVEVEAVVARMSNPSGLQSETIDDYTYRMPETSRRVAILDEWWDLLSPAASTGAFSIRAYYDPEPSEPDPWVTPTEQA